jgi:SRSO17 transposase
MIVPVLQMELPVSWVTGDSVYGYNSKLRGWLEEKALPYVLAVPSQDMVTIGFHQWKVSPLSQTLPVEAWQRLSCLNLRYVQRIGLKDIKSLRSVRKPYTVAKAFFESDSNLFRVGPSAALNAG